MLVKNLNFGKKSKFWSKIKIQCFSQQIVGILDIMCRCKNGINSINKWTLKPIYKIFLDTIF